MTKPTVKKGRSPASSRRVSRDTGRFVILTGLSGAGKTQAIRALEDLGYFCVDNLPTQMIPTMVDLATREETSVGKVAIVVDVREGGFLAQFPRIYRKLKTRNSVSPTLIFLEASDAALVRRFSESRRPHPLAPDRSVSEGIAEERQKLQSIRSMADLVLDTSNLTVHEFRETFMGISRGGSAKASMVLNLVSFGYKHGIPLDADLVFDLRCLPNPYFVDALRHLTGRDQAVIRYMRRNPATREFTGKLEAFLQFTLPYYVQEGKAYLTVAVGCTGGRHRSVMMAETLKRSLSGIEGIRLRVTHRDT